MMETSTKTPSITLTPDILRQVETLSTPPEPFTPGAPLFWDDPHISQYLLEAHLDPNTEAASRYPVVIEAVIDWLLAYLDVQPGAAWLDMGCGPGLYTSRLAQRGLVVTGVDYSRRSIAYATGYATEHKLPITYRYQNYLTLEDSAQYDAISLIYGDFCPLSPENRAKLLANVRRALKPDLGLDRGFAYPNDIYLDQFSTLEPDGTLTVFRNWFQDYNPQRITDELNANGFEVVALWGDLTGAPYTDESDWIGIVAK
jgi:SAM-dependent methyltransferase